jgi:cobalt-zinc-cadmium efflux system outer membrane protein
MTRVLGPSAAVAAALKWSLLALMASSLLLGAGRARAQPLTEADVIRLSAAQNADVAVARAEALAVAARETEAGLYPNPSIEWEREHFPGSDGSREDTLSMTLPIDISGRRSALTSLARSDTHAASAEAARSRSASTVRALEKFYAALSLDARIEVERRALQRLGEFVRILGRRQEEGTASGYERARLEIELGLAENGLRRSEVEAEALRMELVSLLGLDRAPSALRGNATRSGSNVEEKRPPRPASVEMERRSAEEASAAAESAGSAWVPVVSVQGGAKALQSSGATRYGYQAGVAVDIPLFSRGQEVGVRARAYEHVAHARVRAAERAQRFEMLRAKQRLSRTRQELERFREATGERLERLGRASEAGYREGMRTMAELLDAERARLEVELRKIELRAAVQRAELALRAASGEFE